MFNFCWKWDLSRSTTKPAKWPVRPAKTPISLGIRRVWSERLGPQLPIERTAKTLIRLGGFPGWSESSLGAKAILLVLSCCGSFKPFTTSGLFRPCNLDDSICLLRGVWFISYIATHLFQIVYRFWSDAGWAGSGPGLHWLPMSLLRDARQRADYDSYPFQLEMPNLIVYQICHFPFSLTL